MTKKLLLSLLFMAHTSLVLCSSSSTPADSSWNPMTNALATGIDKLEETTRAMGVDLKKASLDVATHLGAEIANKSGEKLAEVTNRDIKAQLDRIPDLIVDGSTRSVHAVAPFVVPVLSCALGACAGIILMYRSFGEALDLMTPKEEDVTNDPIIIEKKDKIRKARWRNMAIRGIGGFLVTAACVTTNSFVQAEPEQQKATIPTIPSLAKQQTPIAPSPAPLA